jgi:LPS-assembly protein
MRDKFLITIYFIIFSSSLAAENIQIESKNITLDKNKQISIFENEVVVTTEDDDVIKSDFAEYNKLTGFIKFKQNVIATDKDNNIIKTNYAEYNEKNKILKTIGSTSVITTENYNIEGTDIILDNNERSIKSKNNTIITDQADNKIYLDNFEYETNLSIFKSVGYIKIEDKLNNTYEFSQVYIDTQKKELIGTDIKAFINDENLKSNKDNDPRIFANTMKMNNEKSSYNKSKFTLCKYRENDKCPPWSIQSTKMLHDNKKKTIYYDNAVIKVYDIPVFYLPKLSHPDPTVKRRSGFLVPSIANSKNLGSGLTVPYFWALGEDKNFTITNKLYASENPLILGEYQQAFKNSSLLTDFGYTKGYKKTGAKKTLGDKNHFFSEFIKSFNFSEESESELKIITQDISNDKYLKLYKIESNLIDYNVNNLENSINYTYNNNDSFFGISTSVFETLNESYEDKYEYILPEVTFDKNLFSSNNLGSLDLQSNYKVRNYDTNKYTNFLVNDFNWISRDVNLQSGLRSNFLGNIKNINYETNNVDLYKDDNTSELFGAIGYKSELNLQKKLGNIEQFLKPKILFRYSPGNMRQETDGSKLDPIRAFNLNRLNNINNFETGLSSTLGFEYKLKTNDKELDFSIAQVINEKENKKMSSKTSMDEKLSDLVGSTQYQINNNIDLKYNFNVDQNYNEINYSEIGTALNLNPFKIDFNYLQEDKHIGDQEYFKTKLEYEKNRNGIISFETKRNLVTDSSEFYNLSYEYLNDCLRAGLVYRREFYADSELEPENSLMFKITLTPFGNIASPSFNQ